MQRRIHFEKKALKKGERFLVGIVLLIALHFCTKIKFHAADSSVFFNLIDTKLNIEMGSYEIVQKRVFWTVLIKKNFAL